MVSLSYGEARIRRLGRTFAWFGAAGALIGSAPRVASAAPLAEAWVRADPRRAEDRAALGAIAGIGPGEGARVDPDGAVWTRVVAEPWALAALRAAFPVVIDAPASDDARAAGAEGGYRYHAPEDVDLAIADLADRAVRGGWIEAGASVLGRPITGLWLGQPPGSGAPVVRLLGGHHGNEQVAVEVALAAAERLVDGDGGADPEVTALLDRVTLWLVPDVNPDGVAANTRENARGVDLNRNYGYAWSASSLRPGSSAFSEPETRAVRALAQVDRPFLSLTLHAGAENLGWPWNFTLDDPPDAPAFAGLAEAYAEGCDAPYFWVTQGADWYPTRGDTNDWAYGRFGGFDLTLELSLDKRPPADQVPGVIGWHLEPIVALLGAPPTVSGRVRGATGAAVDAVVVLEVDGVIGRPIPVDPVTGAFAGLTPSGDGVAHVTAPGYAAVDAPFVAGSDPTPVDLALAPTTAAPARAWPVMLDAATGTVVHLDGADVEGAITLSRVGSDPVVAVAVDGDVALDPAGLDPGWWTLTLPDGEVWPRALHVSGAEGVTVDGWDVEALPDGGTGLRVDAPIAGGARGWAATGPWRALTELPVVDLADDHAVFDLDGLPDGADADPVHVVLATGGAELGLEDVFGIGGPIGRGVDPTRCGCAVGAGSGGWLVAAVGAIAAVRSRARRGSRAPGGRSVVRR